MRVSAVIRGRSILMKVEKGGFQNNIYTCI